MSLGQGLNTAKMKHESSNPWIETMPRRGNGWRKHDIKLGLLFAAVVLLVALAGWFVVRLFSPPVAKPVAIPRVQKPIVPAGSTILPTPVVQAAKTVRPPQTTQQQIAIADAAKQAKPRGPLYDGLKATETIKYEAIAIDDPQVIEAAEVLSQYLKAPTWRERLPFVFNPEGCEPLMKEQYDKRHQQDPAPSTLLEAGIITAGTSRVINLLLASDTLPEGCVGAQFHRTRAGKLLLDWESWAAWCETDWPTFKQERSPLPMVMRAVACESSYYNYEFNENWRWLAVKLRSADGMYNVTGYVERNSVLGVAMANLIGVPLPHKLPDGLSMPAIKPVGSKSFVTVRLRFPVNAQSDHCLRITDLLAGRWVLFPGEEK